MPRNRCKHKDAENVGFTTEGIGDISIKWCPDCGALKRTMYNWKMKDYRWRSPTNRTGGTDDVELHDDQ